MTSGQHFLKQVRLWLVLPILQMDPQREHSLRMLRVHSKPRLRMLPLF